MLIPQFSLRWVLGVTAFCGLLSYIGVLAKDGHAWAVALVVATGSLVVAMAAYALAFFVIWLFSASIRVVSGRGLAGKKVVTESPFAPYQTPFQASATNAANSGPTGASSHAE